jgi:hypothetical protein
VSIGTERRLDLVQAVPTELLKEAEVTSQGRHFGIFAPKCWSVLPPFFCGNGITRSSDLCAPFDCPHTETAADCLTSSLVP